MKRSWAFLAALVLLFPLAALAQSEGYDSRSYARLSYVSGDVHVERAGGLGYEAGTVNLALVEGDKLGLQEGRAEVSLGRQNYIRLDRLTQVEFINLPRGVSESYKLHLLKGDIYLRVSRMDQDKEFEVHTPDASFYILGVGLYRWVVRDSGETRLSVFEGQAEAAGQTGSLEVGSGQSAIARDGNLVSGPERLYASADDFGRWNESRDSLLASRVSGSYLPGDLNEYEPELDACGDWHYEADYGYVWVPQVDYYIDWHPYYYGRWVWYPIIGWTWVPDEPWGWCVYHYGRWNWSLGLGWYWIPTHHWGPAWVHWYWDNDYVGWCALNWWNRPAVVINNVFYNHYGNRDYPVHNSALTVIHKKQLQARRISDMALHGSALDRIGQVRLSNRQPSITPDRLRSGRLYDQARRTFESSGGRPVGQVYSGSRVRSPSLFRSVQERVSLRSPATSRSVGSLDATLSRRSPTSGNRAGSVSQGRPSSRQIREFSPARSTSAPSLSLRSLSQGERSIRSTTSPDSGRGLSSSSFRSEFRSRTSTGKSGSTGSSSRGLTSSRRTNTYSSSISSNRSSPGLTAFPSRSSSGTSRVRPSYDFSGQSRSSSSTVRGLSSPRQNLSSFSRNSSAPSSHSFFNQGSSSPSHNSSFSSSSHSFSSPGRDSSSFSRSSSSAGHGNPASTRSFSSSGHSASSPSSSGSSSSSGHNSSHGGSRIRRR